MAINKGTLAREENGIIEYIYPKSTADMIDYKEGDNIRTVEDKLNALDNAITVVKDLADNYNTALDERLDTLEGIVDTTDDTPIDNRITNAVTVVKDLADNYNTALDERLDTLEGIVDTTDKTPIGTRITNAFTALKNLADNYNTALDERLDTLEGIVDTTDDTPIDNRITNAITDAIGNDDDEGSLSNRIAIVENDINDIDNGLNKRISTIENTIGTDGSIDQRLKSVETAIGNDGSIADQINSAVNVEKSRAEREEDLINSEITTIKSGLDSKIASFVTSERTRAEGEENSIRNSISSLSGELSTLREDLADEISNRSSKDDDIDSEIESINNRLNAIDGKMLVVSSVSDMTDTSRFYINKTDNNWYYYDTDTQAWVQGGNVTGISVDTSLKIAGAAADSKAAGDAINDLSDDIQTEYDGTIGITAGAAVRHQISDLRDLIATTSDFLSVFDFDDAEEIIIEPDAPDTIALNVNDDSISVSWSLVDGAYYTIERSTNGASWVPMRDDQGNSNFTSTTFTDSNVVKGTSYQYRITSHRLDSDGITELSSYNHAVSPAVYAKTNNETPSKPTNISVELLNNNDIKLTWSGSADYYIISRKVGESGSYSQIPNNNVRVSEFTDTNTSEGNTYTYKVVAYSSSGVASEAAYSTSCTIQSSTPSTEELSTPNITEITRGNGTVTVKWTKVNNASGYRVLRRLNTATGEWTDTDVINSIGTNTTISYTDNTGIDKATYVYGVQAYKTINSNITYSDISVSSEITFENASGDDASDITPAQRTVRNITVGWNLANTLDATESDVRYSAKAHTSDEGVDYETSWLHVETTAAILAAVKNKGFNAIRIPVTWNHHLIDDGTGVVTISANFLNRVKTVVDMALAAGFNYVIVNSHHDTADYSNGKGSDYALNSTGLTWETAKPYQLFYTGDSLTTQQMNTMCAHMKNLWKEIATAFTSYDHRLIFEGFNEILGTDRSNWRAPSTTQIEQSNQLNNAFIAGVREAGGTYNPTRVLTCQHYGGQAYLSSNIVTGFDVTDSAGSGYIILQIHYYMNSPSAFAAAARDNIQAYPNYPLIFGEVGWNRGSINSHLSGVSDGVLKNGTGDTVASSLYNFGKDMVEKTAEYGAKVFWWDNAAYARDDGVELLGLLNRQATEIQGSGVWYREGAANGLVAGANAMVEDSGGSTTDTTPTAPTSVTATAGNGKNTITWSGATNAQYYTLERKEGSNTWTAIVSNYTGTSYTDINVTGGISYQYRVTAHRMDTSGNVLSSSTVQSTAITAQTSTGDNWPTAAEIVNDIKVGWTLAGALDCTYEKVKTSEINTDSEGLAYEKGWGNPETTEYTFKAVKEMGFNAVRIPVTWNHHLRSAGNDNITISSYFLDRVKRVVKWAYDEGLYVVINSHYDTAAFSSSQSSTYASSATGLTWNTAIPYQLFNADSTPSNSTQCGYITKLWTQIATAFKDYGYRLMFEGFHEIQGNPRNNSAPTSDQIANVNALNNAFINAVRAVSGNEQRALLCQTYNALNSGDAVTGFNVVNSGYEILDIKLFTDDTSTISGITSTLTSKGYPVVFGTSGWSTAPSGDNANFARTFAQAVKNAGARLFWWDDYGDNYRLLNRSKTNAQTNGSLWSRLETAKALVEGSGGVAGTGLCTVSYDPGTAGGTPITSPETATTVVENIKVGWNLGNTLDCSYDPVRLRDDSGAAVLGTEYEGIGYETGWGDAPATTQAMFEALVNAGFNAIRIPITWNHHLRDAALPDDWGQDKTYTSEIEEYPNLSGNIIISPYFLNRVKTVVNYALNAGFRYVIINSHHDTSDYNASRPFGYAKKVTGLPWITEIPYQLFHASNQLGSNLSNYDPNMTAEDDFNNMCGYMRQLWTLIATAFKDYDYRVIFEGFNEILKYTRSWEEPTELQVARVNGLNNAFISAVRNAGGNYNKYRVLSCETYAAYASNNALNNFSITDSSGGDRIILQAHIYNNAPTEFANAAQRINEKVGIPAIFGEVGWNVNSSAPSDLYSFGYNLVQQAKSKGVKVFWWDNNKQGNGTNYYGLLNRWNTDSNNAEWHKPALLKGLIKGSGQTIDWIENISV